MEAKFDNKKVVILLEGEINSTNAEAKEKEILNELQGKEVEDIELNFNDLTYISSAGLRVILKLKQMYQGLHITNCSLEVYEVFDMTGFTNMMDIKKRLKRVDVTGCPLIGEGYFSRVYRLDKDTIIKVFKRATDINDVQRELNLAKEAFVLGIPTAISFDIVMVGDLYGVRFEMLDCASLKDMFLDEKNDKNELLKLYANLLKIINTTKPMDDKLPDMKEFTLKKLEITKQFYTDEQYNKLKALVNTISDSNTFVHGDCHIKNIMVRDKELFLIDMDTLSKGHPIFELSSIYAPYIAFEEDDPGNVEKFLGIPKPLADSLFYDTLKLYLGDKYTEDNLNKIKLVGYLHMVWWNTVNTPDCEARLNGCRGRLLSLLDKVTTLDF